MAAAEFEHGWFYTVVYANLLLKYSYMAIISGIV